MLSVVFTTCFTHVLSFPLTLSASVSLHPYLTVETVQMLALQNQPMWETLNLISLMNKLINRMRSVRWLWEGKHELPILITSVLYLGNSKKTKRGKLLTFSCLLHTWEYYIFPCKKMFFLKSNRSLFFLLDIDDWVYIINKYQKSLNNFVYILRYLNHFFSHSFNLCYYVWNQSYFLTIFLCYIIILSYFWL